MFRPKPTSRLILLTLTLLLLVNFLTSIKASEPTTDENEDGELEELLALDEQVEQEEEQEGSSASVRSSEAEVLTKAQRIVLELDHDNTERVIEGHEFVLVLGYAPWCSRSAELMPQFAEAATSLKELGSPLLLAKLDAERHPKTASSLEIKGFPTLLLFVNGTSQVYTGGFSAEEIVIWARKKTGEPVIRISSVTEAEEFLKKHNIFVVGLFEKLEGPDYEEFVKAAAADNAIQFVGVSNIEVAKVLFPNVKPTNLFLGIVKSEPERYTSYEGTFEMDKILQFLDYNKLPLVNKLTETNSARVYSSPIKLQVLVFAEADDFKKLLEPLQDVARQFKSKILFIYIDNTDENLAKPYLTLFGLEESNSTVVTAFDISINSKYLLESDPTPSNIKEFCSGLLRGTLSSHFKSQPIPDNTNETVQSIVGKTFDDKVLNSHKNVLLESLEISNGASRPYNATVVVKSLEISNFYIGEGTDFSGVPTKMLTVNGSLRLSVHNSASMFGILVSSAPIILAYSEISVATGQLKKYYQPRKSLRTVSVNLQGTKVPLYGAGSSLTYTKTGGLVPIPLTLKLEIRSRAFVVGKLVKTKHRRRISCPLVLDPTVTKPIKFKKSSCTYE